MILKSHYILLVNQHMGPYKQSKVWLMLKTALNTMYMSSYKERFSPVQKYCFCLPKQNTEKSSGDSKIKVVFVWEDFIPVPEATIYLIKLIIFLKLQSGNQINPFHYIWCPKQLSVLQILFYYSTKINCVSGALCISSLQTQDEEIADKQVKMIKELFC